MKEGLSLERTARAGDSTERERERGGYCSLYDNSRQGLEGIEKDSAPEELSPFRDNTKQKKKEKTENEMSI